MKTFATKIVRIALHPGADSRHRYFRTWSFTESPWTHDTEFSADMVAIAPGVGDLITEVPILDNWQVKKIASSTTRVFEAVVERQREVSRRRSLGSRHIPRTDRSGQ
ncbi:MAG: p-hydroxybenzoic acid efflux pump subunit AaeA [Sodalis sp.]|nr:MAG: p-hydroxybenzoic acid efflux pump subunit AaeA [Sodalis sp.]